MPKKVSMTPATKRSKKTPVIAKAETDQNWASLASTRKKSGKVDTKIPTNTQRDCNLQYSKDDTKFPYNEFPIRLEYKDGNDKKTCWFQCYDHYIKHITRYKVTNYEATTNNLALVGESTGAKSKQQRRRS
jgi:hypothetical protein